MAQWLTLLAPLIESVKTPKRGRTTEGTPKMTSKRQQLLASKAPKGKATKERANRKRQAETQEETPARPITIIPRGPVQLEPDPLAMKIKIGTEEEAEEDPIEHRQTCRGVFGPQRRMGRRYPALRNPYQGWNRNRFKQNRSQNSLRNKPYRRNRIRQDP